MLTKYNFELELEKISERFYHNAGSQLLATRGGNSRGNEVYFGNVSSDLRKEVKCQLIVLPKGECPDSGIFGNFNYKSHDDVDWERVREKKSVVIEVNAPNSLKMYIEVNLNELNIPDVLTNETEICLKLNDLNGYGEFFGIEYKASKNGNEKSIAVASFNSTCPSDTKTTELNKIVLIHNLDTNYKRYFDKEKTLKKHLIKLKIQFSMYYFIVNDEEVGSRSEIRHIFICRGSFFAPTTSEEQAAKYSKQLYPEDLNIPLNLYRVKLRYRPFFESRSIKASGYGLYTSWEPKIPGLEREATQRKLLMDEVEKIQQEYGDEVENVGQRKENNFENVIYLNLKAGRIKARSVA